MSIKSQACSTQLKKPEHQMVPGFSNIFMFIS